jgi:hypothetical protein
MWEIAVLLRKGARSIDKGGGARGWLRRYIIIYKDIQVKREESAVTSPPRHVVGTEFCFFSLVEAIIE